MSMKPVLLSAVAALCLFLPIEASAAAPKPSKSMNAPIFQLRAPWAVQSITQGKDFASCRVSAQFDNDTVLQFTHSSAQGLENMSVAFGGDMFTPRETYPVTVSAPGKETQKFDGVATNASTIMLPLGKGAAVQNDVWKSALVTLDMNGASYRFSMAGLEQTTKKLNDCLHPDAAAQTVEADPIFVPAQEQDNAVVPMPPQQGMQPKSSPIVGKNEAPAPVFEVVDAPYTEDQPSSEVKASIAASLDDNQTATTSKSMPSPSLTTVVGGDAAVRKVLDQAPSSGDETQTSMPAPILASSPIVTPSSAPAPSIMEQLDKLTKLYQESEKQNRELGQQLMQEREQWAQERKTIETKLFDPQISTEEQRLKLYDLEKKVSELEKELGRTVH